MIKRLAIAQLLFVLLAPAILVGQAHLDLGGAIIPLQTTRAEVEKIAKFIKTEADFVQYEINGRQLDVYFNEVPCLTFGWNVPTDTVIEFKYGLRPGELSYDDIKKSIVSVERINDIKTRSVIDRDRGVKYDSPSGHDHVTSMTVMPRAGKSNLRCKGFPEYDPSRIYPWYQRKKIEDLKTWDPNEVYTTIYYSERLSSHKATIFIYSEKGEKSKCQPVRKLIERFASRVIGSKAKDIKVECGGYRDSLQVETFLLPIEYPPPTPTPTHPSEF